MEDRDIADRGVIEAFTGIPPGEQGWRMGPTPGVIPEGFSLEHRTDGSWRLLNNMPIPADVLRATREAVPVPITVTDEAQAEIAGRFAEMFPPHTPGRIEGARRKAQFLGVPFTPDMTITDAKDGTRAVDGLGRVGTFRSQTHASSGKSLLLFRTDEPDSSIPEALRAPKPSEAALEWPLVVSLSALERAWVLISSASDWDLDRPNWREAARVWCDEVWHPARKQSRDADRADAEPDLYSAPAWLRNGRESGAWAAGIAMERGRVLVEVEPDHVDGAVTSLVAAGMMVARRGEDGETGRVRLEIQSPEDLTANRRLDPPTVLSAGEVSQPVLSQGEGG